MNIDWKQACFAAMYAFADDEGEDHAICQFRAYYHGTGGTTEEAEAILKEFEQYRFDREKREFEEAKKQN